MISNASEIRKIKLKNGRTKFVGPTKTLGEISTLLTKLRETLTVHSVIGNSDLLEEMLIQLCHFLAFSNYDMIYNIHVSFNPINLHETLLASSDAEIQLLTLLMLNLFFQADYDKISINNNTNSNLPSQQLL